MTVIVRATLPSAKRPSGRAWRQERDTVFGGLRVHHFWLGTVHVSTSIQVARMPDGHGDGPQWLVSVSDSGKRPKPHHVRKALRAFGMVGAEEDNHHPGVARHFFLVCDPARRVACECKTDEKTIVESDGYRWTTPVSEDEECRGCEFQRLLGRPCPLHATPKALGPMDGDSRLP